MTTGGGGGNYTLSTDLIFIFHAFLLAVLWQIEVQVKGLCGETYRRIWKKYNFTAKVSKSGEMCRKQMNGASGRGRHYYVLA